MRPGSVSPQAGVSLPLSNGGRGRTSFARPKSMIFACPDSVSITFFGLRSRWTTPCACASASPSATSIARSRARAGASGVSAISEASGRPRTSSIAMKVEPSASSIS